MRVPPGDLGCCPFLADDFVVVELLFVAFPLCVGRCWVLGLNNLGLDARKPVIGVCEQQRRRPACASAQSDQRLRYSLIGKYHI